MNDMADFVFNAAKGRVIEKLSDSPSVGVLLLKVAGADGLMRKQQTIEELLTTSTEADFTNYARKTVTATVTEDDVRNRVDANFADITWTDAGGGVGDNALVKLITFYDDGGTDATRIPLTAHDFKVTTNGTDLLAEVADDGFFRAA